MLKRDRSSGRWTSSIDTPFYGKQVDLDEEKRRKRNILDMTMAEDIATEARHRWKNAIIAVIQLNMVMKLFAIADKEEEEERDTEKQVMNNYYLPTKSLQYVMKQFQRKIDQAKLDKVNRAVLASFFYSTLLLSCLQIIFYLSKPPGTRGIDDMLELERLFLSTILSFSKYDTNQRTKFCLCLVYEFHPKGKTIIKEGYGQLFFYFLLSGQCEAYQDRKGAKWMLNVINSGDDLTDFVAGGCQVKLFKLEIFFI